MTKEQLIDHIIKQAKIKNKWQWVYFKQDDHLFKLKMFEKWIQIFELKNKYIKSGSMYNKTYKDLRLELLTLLDQYQDAYEFLIIDQSIYLQ